MSRDRWSESVVELGPSLRGQGWDSRLGPGWSRARNGRGKQMEHKFVLSNSDEFIKNARLVLFLR